MWHQLEHTARNHGGRLSARVRIPARSTWFDGHFPGDPVLPAVAQLGVIRDLIDQALDGHPGVAAYRRVKFKRMIRPREVLDIIAEPKTPGEAYTFRITVGDEVACTGTVVVRTAAP